MHASREVHAALAPGPAALPSVGRVQADIPPVGRAPASARARACSHGARRERGDEAASAGRSRDRAGARTGASPETPPRALRRRSREGTSSGAAGEAPRAVPVAPRGAAGLRTTAGGRGARALPPGVTGALGAALLLLAAGVERPASAQEAPLEALRAWRAGPRRAALAGRGTAEREPVELEVARPAAEARLGELLAAARWVDAADLLARTLDEPAPELRLAPATGPGPALTGAPARLRGRTALWPEAAAGAWRSLVGASDRRAPAGERALDEAAWWSRLARDDGRDADGAARRLAERLLERGDLAGATLVLRRASARPEGPTPLEAARLLAARAALGPERAGGLGAAAAPAAGTWQVRWAREAGGGDLDRARPVAADGERVYCTDRRGALALGRDDGRLRWRWPGRGDPRADRLALGHDLVVVARGGRVVALRAPTGQVAWERPLVALSGHEGQAEDRLVDVTATAVGFAALTVFDGARCLVSVDPTGRVRWRARLWAAHEGPVAAHALAPGPRPPSSDRVVVALDRARAVTGDGRLAALGDRVLLTADGLVAAFDAASGELLWLSDRAPGLAAAGEHVLVDLAVGPFAAAAVTATGLLVRLDPLDGRPLAAPVAPPEVQRAAEDPDAPPARPPAPYVLAAEPLVVGYPAPDGFWLAAGVPGRARVRFALGPLGPGVVRGGTLALPDGEGVVLVDLATGREVGLVPWPLSPGPLALAGNLLLVAGPDGLAALELAPAGEGAPAEAPAPWRDGPPSLDDPRAWATALDDPDWRRRFAARRALLEATGDKARLLIERLAHDPLTSVDTRDQLLDLSEQEARRALVLDLAPRVAPRLLEDLVRGVDLARRLQELKRHVSSGAAGHPILREAVLAAEDPEVRRALFELLLRVDARARDRVTDVVLDPGEPQALREVCAGLVVELAARGGASGPLQRLIVATQPPDAWPILVAAAARTLEPERARALLPETRTVTRIPVLGEEDLFEADRLLLRRLPRLLE